MDSDTGFNRKVNTEPIVKTLLTPWSPSYGLEGFIPAQALRRCTDMARRYGRVSRAGEIRWQVGNGLMKGAKPPPPPPNSNFHVKVCVGDSMGLSSRDRYYCRGASTGVGMTSIAGVVKLRCNRRFDAPLVHNINPLYHTLLRVWRYLC